MSPGDPLWLFSLQFLLILGMISWLVWPIIRDAERESRESTRRALLDMRDMLRRDIERQELEETLSRLRDPKSGGHHG